MVRLENGCDFGCDGRVAHQRQLALTPCEHVGQRGPASAGRASGAEGRGVESRLAHELTMTLGILSEWLSTVPSKKTPSPYGPPQSQVGRRSVGIVPRDGEHTSAPRALQLGRLGEERAAVAARRANGVARAPVWRHVDRVPRAGHNGPAFRTHGNDLEHGARDGVAQPIHLQNCFAGG